MELFFYLNFNFKLIIKKNNKSFSFQYDIIVTKAPKVLRF
jgi:hypothetical protein